MLKNNGAKLLNTLPNTQGVDESQNEVFSEI